MTDDVTYTYIKGQGWVPRTHVIVSSKVGNHMFIVEARPPEVGERYWTYIEPEEALKILVGDYDALEDQWDGDPPGVLRVHEHYHQPRSFWNDPTLKFVTITTVRLT
jgi:hypothetical protein